MPLQNRVTPFGEIVAHPARGGLMGNRGILHDDRRTLGAARWRHANWVTCVLAFKGRHRAVMSPRRYTELFFLDEAVALAAGHRPCAECRRADYNAFRAGWAAALGGEMPSAKAMDRVLHAARIERPGRRQHRHLAPIDKLPDGVFVVVPGNAAAWLVRGARLHPFAYDRYGDPVDRPAGLAVEVLTPRPTVAALAAGYRPAVHRSVRR